MKNPTAILTADWHLRDDTPVCRTDDFQAALWRKIEFISELRHEHDSCPILFAGDLFHHWKPSPALLRSAIKKMPPLYAIPGQHDLPQHNIELINRSGFGVIEEVERLFHFTEHNVARHVEGFFVTGAPFGKMPELSSGKGRHVALLHTLVLNPHNNKIPSALGVSGKELLRKLKGFDLALVGDNHQSFVVEDKGRLLVSPGSLMRQTADQIDHKPCVYLWDAKKNEVEPVYLPIEQGVVSREHIERVEHRRQRIDAFVEHLREKGFEVACDFRGNIKFLITENKIHPNTQKAIWEALDGIENSG